MNDYEKLKTESEEKFEKLLLLISPSIASRYETRFNYILSIALQRNVASIVEFLKNNEDLCLKNLIKKANARSNNLLKN